MQTAKKTVFIWKEEWEQMPGGKKRGVFREWKKSRWLEHYKQDGECCCVDREGGN